MIFDLETATGLSLPPIPDAALNKGIQKNWGDDARKKRQAINRKEWVQQAATDYRTGQIVAAGWATEVVGAGLHIVFQGPPVELERAPEEPDGTRVQWVDSERALVELIWKQLGDDARDDLVGFGLRDFDLPTLMYRSAVHRIDSTRLFDLRRYTAHQGVVDWLELLAAHSPSRWSGWGLQDYMRAPELVCPHEPFGEGKHVPQRWADGDYQYIIDHLRSDLLGIRWLHDKFARHYLGRQTAGDPRPRLLD